MACMATSAKIEKTAKGGGYVQRKACSPLRRVGVDVSRKGYQILFLHNTTGTQDSAHDSPQDRSQDRAQDNSQRIVYSWRLCLDHVAPQEFPLLGEGLRGPSLIFLVCMHARLQWE